MKCEQCDKPATVHLTAINGGKKTEKHLCVDCAGQNLPSTSKSNMNELLTKFVAKHQQQNPE